MTLHNLVISLPDMYNTTVQVHGYDDDGGTAKNIPFIILSLTSCFMIAPSLGLV